MSSSMAALLLLAIASRPAVAQLRPLEPMPWRLAASRQSISAEFGVARLEGQRASLTGESGDLWEAGTFAVAWRTGRVVIEGAGTARRFFHARSRFADPYPDVEPVMNENRHDSGDYRISTMVRITPDASSLKGALRFGVRLPTTDNTIGLERDATDFFATIGASTSGRSLDVSAEAGLGINTTREQTFEQDDLFLYAVRAEYNAMPLVPSVAVLGQMHGTAHSSIRGVENLGEIRAGLRAGQSRWVRAELVKGYETFSPELGFIITAGFVF